MESKIWLSSPHMCGKEKDFVASAFDTNWIAPLGPNVDGFEDDITKFLKEDIHVAALSSGTAAIHLGLKLLNVGVGDEVICQSKTFSASANPIVYLGAKPIFVDSENLTWNICPEALEEAIKDRIRLGKKPKAIVAVHLYGMPYQVDKIHAIAKHFDIPILEDSAEALGSTFNNQQCGTFGDIAILSFNGNKIITTSGGGALVTRNKTIRDKAVFLSTQARDKAVEYLHSNIGYNYRLSNVLAGIGRGQMSVLKERVLQRRANYSFYKSNLKNIAEITFVDSPEGYFSNRWLSCILLENETQKNGLINHLNSFNIESRPLWKPMHQQPIFKDAPKYLTGISDNLFKKGLCLPSGSNLEDTERQRVLDAINSFFKK